MTQPIIASRSSREKAATMETTLEDIDFAGLTSREFFPSPAAWEDEVLYFLMLDRFSDGQEDGYRDNDGNLVRLF